MNVIVNLPQIVCGKVFCFSGNYCTGVAAMKDGKICIVSKHLRSRDPDSDSEVESYCGEIYPCTGSGRHFLKLSPVGATCSRCIDEFRKDVSADAELV